MIIATMDKNFFLILSMFLKQSHYTNKNLDTNLRYSEKVSKSGSVSKKSRMDFSVTLNHLLLCATMIEDYVS